MQRRKTARIAVATAVAAGSAALGCLGIRAAHAATSGHPRPGPWAGEEANGTAPSQVSFTVEPTGGAVSDFSGEGIVKAGCTNHIQGFSAPTGPMTVTNGRFRGVETSYPQRGVRVVVTGTFTTRTKARGRIQIHFKRVDGCDAVRRFSARPATS
jgi:hypothetical protein